MPMYIRVVPVITVGGINSPNDITKGKRQEYNQVLILKSHSYHPLCGLEVGILVLG